MAKSDDEHDRVMINFSLSHVVALNITNFTKLQHGFCRYNFNVFMNFLFIFICLMCIGTKTHNKHTMMDIKMETSTRNFTS